VWSVVGSKFLKIFRIIQIDKLTAGVAVQLPPNPKP
jgi:hypothetical protein